ncbi:MAG: tetratricopeptide repeat protein [Bacteroidales bacterium]|nr:tetratricopeptide repeat protein [Bacteroidales bacterium]
MKITFKKNWTIEGNEKYLRGEYKATIKCYTKAIESDELDAEAFLNRGITFHDMGLFSEAISDFTEAINLIPNYSEAYRNRALAYYSIKDSRKALADYNKASQLAGAS